MLAFFRRQNGRAFFPPLPIAALLRRRMGGGEGQISAGWDISARGGRFCKAKGQKGFQIMLACGASRRACCQTVVCIRQQNRKPHQTGEPRGLSPSGGLGDESAGNARSFA